MVAEAQRRAQLSQLGPLLPEGPGKLLSAYKQVAMTFQLHRVCGLQEDTIVYSVAVHCNPPGYSISERLAFFCNVGVGLQAGCSNRGAT